MVDVKDIELMIIGDERFFNIRTDIALPNVSWSLLPYEADLLIMNKSGYMTEFEIKRSLADLKHDFDKRIFHYSELISKFYYVLPIDIEDKTYRLFEEHFEDEKYIQVFGGQEGLLKPYPNVIFYDEKGIQRVDTKGHYHVMSRYRKLFIEEKLTLLRLFSIRYWNLRKKQ